MNCGLIYLLFVIPVSTVFIQQPHLLILLVAQFTATRLRPVLGVRPVGTTSFMAARYVWNKSHPPGDVTIKKYCKSLFFHKCLWNSSASAENLAADWAGRFGIVSVHHHFI